MKKVPQGKVKGVGTFNGRVYAYVENTTQPGGRHVRHLVNCRDALEKFCRDFVQQDMETFLNGWRA